MSRVAQHLAFSNRSRGLPKLGRNYCTPDPSPTRDAKDLPACASLELDFVIEVDGKIQPEGFLSDDEEDDREEDKEELPTTGVSEGEHGQSVCSEPVQYSAIPNVDVECRSSSIHDDLQAANDRLAKENEALRREKQLVEENHRLLMENMLLRQRCDEIKKSVQTDTDKANPGDRRQPVNVSSEDRRQPVNVSSEVAPGLAMSPPPFGIQQQQMQNSISLAAALNDGNPACVQGGSCVPGGFWMGLPVSVPMEMMPQAVMVGSSEKQLAATKKQWHNSREDRAEQLFAKQAAFVSCPPELETEEPPVLECSTKPEERTTVMLRNLPNNYSRIMLLDLIDSEGFQGRYDFLYLPIDFTTRACLGYGFVNLVSFEVACEFMKVFHNFSEWIIPSRKHCLVSWSGPHQGLQEHIERYRNSPVMHPAVPDECKPVIFKQGVRMAFPPPTKKVRAPRVRQVRCGN